MNKVDNTILVIGLGRVGLPLLLFLEKKKFNLIGLDQNRALISKLKEKKMPFVETGCQKLLKKSNAKFINNFKEFNPKKVKYILITVGTPLRESIEVNLNNINLVINELSKILIKGHTIILRSTIGPETTYYVKKKNRKVDKL